MSFLADTNTIIYASKAPEGAIDEWFSKQAPYLTEVSYREALQDWKFANDPQNARETAYLEALFRSAGDAGRFVSCAESPGILSRAYVLTAEHNLRPDDALIAAAAEHLGLTLVTADVTKNFAPRLEKLNAEGLGAFHLRTYAYETREETFAKWNAESPG